MKFRNSVAPLVAFFALVAACSSSDQSADDSAAGATSHGGSPGTAGSKGGTGGASGSPTSAAGRGGSSVGSAGTSGGAGMPGGGTPNGGSPNAGAPSGGTAGAGGNLGGAAGKGGTGGMSGGGSGNAGRGGNGGTSAGGSAGKGGTGGGGAAGMSGSGNAGSTSCSFPSSWAPGNATYTTYTLPNPATACGYTGTNNNITNIAVGANYAAIPGMSSSNFDTSSRCGACVQIGNAIITIVDECPYDNGQNVPCNNNKTGHLDLSQTGASAGNVTGNPATQGQNQWKFVPCPINGNVMVRLKNGNNNEVYIENEILPIASVTCDGQTGSRQSYGAWHFTNNINGKSCTVTDISNRTISVAVGNTQGQNVNSGVQFPKCN